MLAKNNCIYYVVIILMVLIIKNPSRQLAKAYLKIYSKSILIVVYAIITQGVRYNGLSLSSPSAGVIRGDF